MQNLPYSLLIFFSVPFFIIGQFILKLVIEPIVPFKQTLGEISYLLLLHQAKITNGFGDPELQEEIRRISAQLMSRKQAISWYKLISSKYTLPSEDKVISACRSLNAISYFLDETMTDVNPKVNRPYKIIQEMQEIQRNLNIRVHYT